MENDINEPVTTVRKDDLVRCVLWPRILKDQAFAPEQIIAFDKYNGRYEISIGVGDLLPTNEKRHGFGCRVAENARESSKSRGGDGAIHYVGHFLLNKPLVESINTDVHDVYVKHEPEDNLYEHGVIEATAKRDARKAERTASITEITRQISDLLTGGLGHICPCDEHIREKIEISPFPELNRKQK